MFILNILHSNIMGGSPLCPHQPGNGLCPHTEPEQGAGSTLAGEDRAIAASCIPWSPFGPQGEEQKQLLCPAPWSFVLPLCPSPQKLLGPEEAMGGQRAQEDGVYARWGDSLRNRRTLGAAQQ